MVLCIDGAAPKGSRSVCVSGTVNPQSQPSKTHAWHALCQTEHQVQCIRSSDTRTTSCGSCGPGRRDASALRCRSPPLSGLLCCSTADACGRARSVRCSPPSVLRYSTAKAETCTHPFKLPSERFHTFSPQLFPTTRLNSSVIESLGLQRDALIAAASSRVRRNATDSFVAAFPVEAPVTFPLNALVSTGTIHSSATATQRRWIVLPITLEAAESHITGK